MAKYDNNSPSKGKYRLVNRHVQMEDSRYPIGHGTGLTEPEWRKFAKTYKTPTLERK